MDETKFLREKVQELQAAAKDDEALLSEVLDLIDNDDWSHLPAAKDLAAKVEKRLGRPPGYLNRPE